jgi:hypothetical protein
MRQNAAMSASLPSDPAARIDRNFAARVDWNLLRTFVEIVRAGGIGVATPQLVSPARYL